jgi:hypothetical protein
MARSKRDISNSWSWKRILTTSGLLALLVASTAHGIILFRTADPNANTTAPTNDPAASGWNYEGQFGGFLGTPIAPHFFLSAGHIGDASNTLVYGGVTYTVAAHFNDPFSDLNMWQINETFPSFAPLYTKDNERGLRIVAIGRGTQRGNEVLVDGQLRGWFCGNGDGRQRWGENLVFDIVTFSSGPDDGLYATFDQNGLPDECHFSSGDSGGAVFIQDEGVWKLAGINYAVDGHFYTDASGNGQFDAAMFDAGGFYESDGANPPNYVQVPANTPTGLYATRISSKLAWIYYVTDPTGDADGDGISNLLNYARTLNDPLPRGYGSPVLSKNGSSLTFTYRKINNAPGLTYLVEQSSDLVDWTPASAQNQVTSTRLNIDTVATTVNIGSANSLFLRLKITQP